MAMIWVIFLLMDSNEMLWSPCRFPVSLPVSCCGKKPLGMMVINQTFRPIVTSNTSRTSREWSNALASDRA